MPPTKTEYPKVIAAAAVERVRQDRATARRWSNVEPGISVRDGSGYAEWDYFRPEQAPPTDPREKMAAAMQAHERFGVIRNTIDMMSEFACQGIDLVHPVPSVERFYREWWRKVRGAHVTERQLNLLYRAGTVPTKRTWATLPLSQADLVKRGLAGKRVTAAWDDTGDVKPDVGGKAKSRRVPWRYTVLNPLSLEVLATPDIAPLVGDTALNYGVRVNKILIDQLRLAKEKNLWPEFKEQIDTLLDTLGGGEVVPVPRDDLRMMFYKKDDWQLWATPMLFSLHRDLQQLDQLRLADMAALDGAASHVRLWKLGDLKNQMWPGQPAVDKLADILSARAPGEVLDIIWGPDIELVETKADGAAFLGDEKYRPVWAAIFGGLGVPLSLTGVLGGGQAGTTNNWASLKTLVERLEYGRSVVSEFWQEEIRLVQRAMNFAKPATLVFDRQSLTDEATILRLFVELMDRNVVSREAVQERFSLVPEIESVRTNREFKKQRRGQIPPKGGAWDDPTFEQKVLLELVRQQRITPQQANVDLIEDDKLPAGKKDRALPPAPAPAPGSGGSGGKGEPGQGRPPGKKDSKRRKQPKFTPRASAVAGELVAMGLPDPPPELVDDVLMELGREEVTPESVQRAAFGVYNRTTTESN